MLIDRQPSRKLARSDDRLPSVIVAWRMDDDATAIVTPLPHPRGRPARRWWLAGALAAIALGVVIGVGTTAFGPVSLEAPPPPPRVEIAAPAPARPPDPIEVIAVEAAPEPAPIAPKRRPPKKPARAPKPEPTWDPKSLFLREAPR